MASEDRGVNGLGFLGAAGVQLRLARLHMAGEGGHASLGGNSGEARGVSDAGGLDCHSLTHHGAAAGEYLQLRHGAAAGGHGGRGGRGHGP